MVPVPKTPRRRHPNLTRSRPANEHLTFAIMHHMAAKDPSLPARIRATHRLAAKANESSVIHHMRLLKAKAKAT